MEKQEYNIRNEDKNLRDDDTTQFFYILFRILDNEKADEEVPH